jgi:hypothetical protein
MFSRFSNLIRITGQRVVKTTAPETKTVTIPRESGESPVQIRIPEGKKVSVNNTKEGLDFTMDDGTQLFVPHNNPAIAEAKPSVGIKEIHKGSLNSKPVDALPAETKPSLGEGQPKLITLEDAAKTAQQVGVITDTAVKVTTVATGVVTGAGILVYSTVDQNTQRGETSVANQQTKLEIDSLPTDSMGPY